MKEKVEELFEQYRLMQKTLSQVKAEILLLFDVSESVEPVGEGTVCDVCGTIMIEENDSFSLYCPKCGIY